MIVNLVAGVKLDGQRVTVVAHSANGRTVDEHQAHTMTLARHCKWSRGQLKHGLSHASFRSRQLVPEIEARESHPSESHGVAARAFLLPAWTKSSETRALWKNPRI